MVSSEGVFSAVDQTCPSLENVGKEFSAENRKLLFGVPQGLRMQPQEAQGRLAPQSQFLARCRAKSFGITYDSPGVNSQSSPAAMLWSASVHSRRLLIQRLHRSRIRNHTLSW